MKYLTFDGPSTPQYGYGRMFVSLRDELAKQVELVEKAEVAVFAMQPDMVQGWFDGQRTAVFCMWETDSLPEKFWRYMPRFDTVIVPCEQNRELFAEYHDNVHVVTLGIDRSVWFPVKRKPNKVFRIICGGSQWNRKGLDVVLAVFNEMALPGAVLEIKIVPPYFDAPKEVNSPNVTVHRQWMSLEDEVAWVRSADLFVAASRGEGFGFMPLQAISTGIPTIVTDRRGHKEFSHLATHKIGAGLSESHIGKWGNCGLWDEPDREELRAAIQDAYDNRDRYRTLAVQTAPRTSIFNWKASATKLLKIVAPTSKLVDGAWDPHEPRLRIRVNRHVRADIGKHHVDLCVGQVHSVVINVRDVLEESGYLLSVE